MATSPTTFTGDITALVAAPGISPQTDALLGGSKWGTGAAGTGAALTFSFPATVAAFDTRAGITGNYNENEPLGAGLAARLTTFSAFSAEQQEAARQVLQAFASVANLSFTEVVADSVDAGVLRFGNVAPPGIKAGTWGESWWPQDFAGAGDTWMNSTFLFPEGWARGTQNFLTLLHEVGHALGLKHPHDAGPSSVFTGWPQNNTTLPVTEGTTLANESTQTMVMAYNDIAGRGLLDGLSLQSDFAPTTPMRWDIAALQVLYGANMATNAGDTVYTFAGEERYNQTLWDGGGVDTIVATGSRAAEIDLRGGQWSKLGQPMTFSTRNEVNAVVAAQPQFTDPYTVFLYDTVTIENASGGDGFDVIYGNAIVNVLEGGAGNDTVYGLDGNDTIRGGDGFDVIAGGAGSDQLDGGEGIADIADYRGEAAVSLSLLAGGATQGDDADTLAGFEAIFGSSAADLLQGRETPEHLRSDTIRGGGGEDSIDGLGGVDMVEFSGARAGYTVTRTATGFTVQDTDTSNGDDGLDRLAGVERLMFADRMLAFGSRAEEIARVAFVLWTKDIVGSGTLFSRGYSFYDNGGYDFATMSGVALMFHAEQGEAYAQKLIDNMPGQMRTAADILAIMANAGGGEAGRIAALIAVTNDPATEAAIVASGIRVNGVVADLFVPGFGNLFGLLPG